MLKTVYLAIISRSEMSCCDLSSRTLMLGFWQAILMLMDRGLDNMRSMQSFDSSLRLSNSQYYLLQVIIIC